MWQVDRFGKNAQLPQIYKKSGYRYVAFRSGCPERKPSEFLWEGLDGTKIIAHWMPLGFMAGFDLNQLEKKYLGVEETFSDKPHSDALLGAYHNAPAPYI